ncbi:MAG: biopolymer transporter ExbD [Planctomycetota bacterium]|jgi:biopolymer transport protein ExbD|nr:biopolymer transporter ExbD [Pirellulales bacterium]MDA0255252.1 biopolymer transporter ExbD [Planctomycetota bacterium]MDA1200748.1 biopolymer transporter ExbD [Planctomycetota bacterium]
MPLVRLASEEEPAPNLTPMIDVILVITIFFMCATKFSGDERQFELDLPEVGAAAAVAAGRPEIVEVEAAGALRLGSDEVSLEELGSRLTAAREASPELAVMIRGERAVSHGRMAEIYETCRSAGVRHVAISVRTGAGSARK